MSAHKDNHPHSPAPLTRAEFVAAEVQMGIEAQGIPGVDFYDLDPDTMTAIRQRAEWNAQAAERAGVVWGEPPTAGIRHR